MKKIIVPLAVLALIILAGGLYYFSLKKPNTTQVETQKAGNSTLVGRDKDKNDCIGSAGYTWCDVKNKCLRIWEEKCDAEAEKSIQELLAKKYNKPTADVRVSVIKATKNHAVGSVSFAPFDGNNEGGMFLAVKVEVEWQLVYDGNGSINCADMENYGFPKDMLTGFCD